MWDNRGLFAIQGPKAAEVLQRLSPSTELKSVPFGQCFWMTLEGAVPWLLEAFRTFSRAISGHFSPCFHLFSSGFWPFLLVFPPKKPRGRRRMPRLPLRLHRRGRLRGLRPRRRGGGRVAAADGAERSAAGGARRKGLAALGSRAVPLRPGI